MCSYAQEWAQNLAARYAMQHRTNSPYGENIYMMQGSNVNVTAKMPVDSWYDEIKFFQFGFGGFSMQTGHFTQVIWKQCSEIGVGKASNRLLYLKLCILRNAFSYFTYSSGQTYVVTNYNPPGNYTGQFNENVPRKL
jgi:glioma pathogenesis-related protein 2